MHKYMPAEMPDGSQWDDAVEMIARNRAEHYASEFDGDIKRSFIEGTIPLFDDADYEIQIGLSTTCTGMTSTGSR